MGPFHLAISLFFTVLLMGILGLQVSTRIACLSCAVVMVVWSLNPAGSPWAFALHRFLDSCLGIAVGLLVSHFLFPSETKKKLLSNKKIIFSLFSASLQSKNNEPLKKAQKLLQEDEQLIKELQAEWTGDQDSKDRWETLDNGEKSLLFLLTNASTLSKENLPPLLDQRLIEKTGDAIEKSLKRPLKNWEKGKKHNILSDPLYQ